MSDDTWTIRRAAAALGVSRSRLRTLIEAGQLRAFRVGGTDAQPWLRVYPHEARQAFERACEYVPKGGKRRKEAARPRGALHPGAAAMLRD